MSEIVMQYTLFAKRLTEMGRMHTCSHHQRVQPGAPSLPRLRHARKDQASAVKSQFSRTHPAKFCKQRPAPSSSCDQSTPFGRWSLRNRVSFAPTRYKIRHQQAHSLSSRRQARACLRSSTQRCDCQFNRWPASLMARHSSKNTGTSDL